MNATAEKFDIRGTAATETLATQPMESRRKWIEPSIKEIRPRTVVIGQGSPDRLANIHVLDFATRPASPNLSNLRGFFDEADLVWRATRFTADRKRTLAVSHVRDSAIMDRLDDTCGPENWRNTFAKGPNAGVICGLSIRIDGEWITKWDTNEVLPYTEGARRSGGENLAGRRRVIGSGLRRAALQWGIGRYLERLPKQWVPVDARGRVANRPALPPDFRTKTQRNDFESVRLGTSSLGKTG